MCNACVGEPNNLPKRLSPHCVCAMHANLSQVANCAAQVSEQVRNLVDSTRQLLHEEKEALAEQMETEHLHKTNAYLSQIEGLKERLFVQV